MRKVLAALALTSLVGGEALAFEIKTNADGRPVHWPQMPVTFAIDAAGSRDMPLEEAEQSVRGAFDEWGEVHGSGVRFRYLGLRTGLRVGYEGDGNVNAVVWSRDEWVYEPDALAITLSLYRRDTAEIVDADIIVNERAYTWGVGEVENDLQNAITHEIGHFLGFGHSGVEDATMFASASRFETKKRTLHDDDENGVLRLYPRQVGRDLSGASAPGAAFRDDSVSGPGEAGTAAPPPEELPQLGCSATRGAPASGLGPWALMLLGLRRRHPDQEVR